MMSRETKADKLSTKDVTSTETDSRVTGKSQVSSIDSREGHRLDARPPI